MGLGQALVVLIALPALARAAPAPLACLARYYAVRAVEEDGRWFAQLPGGQRLVYDDAHAKTFAERLAAPDVKDAFLLRYVPGPIMPVTTLDSDPGRVRLDAVLRATYPRRDVTRITFLGQPLHVHARVVDALARVEARLVRARAAEPSLRPFLEKLGGALAVRNIAGTDRPSAHAYGIALDVNVERSDYWRWQTPLRWRNRIPQAIVDAFEAEGFIWGGRWYHYDTMHFEYRPELLDESCYP